MSIGLYDQDMATYALVPFNLELMKLAAYYKKKRQIVVLSRRFCPERYEKFFLQKDYDDDIFIPNTATTPNLSYGGLAFTDNIYKPMAREIEICKPDTSIYERFEKEIGEENDQKRKTIFRAMYNANHCRISLDGKSVWKDYRLQLKEIRPNSLIFFHDYNLGNIEGALAEIQKLITDADVSTLPRIGAKFPITTSNEKEFLEWTQLPQSSIFFTLQFRGVMSDENFSRFLELEVSSWQRIEYNITAEASSEEDFIKNDLSKILRQVIFSRRFSKHFLLKYDKDFFMNKEWEKVVHLICDYANTSYPSQTITLMGAELKDCLFQYARSLPNERCHDNIDFSRKDARALFEFVRKNNYPLFKEFYECTTDSLEGGLT